MNILVILFYKRRTLEWTLLNRLIKLEIELSLPCTSLVGCMHHPQLWLCQWSATALNDRDTKPIKCASIYSDISRFFFFWRRRVWKPWQPKSCPTKSLSATELENCVAINRLHDNSKFSQCIIPVETCQLKYQYGLKARTQNSQTKQIMENQLETNHLAKLLTMTQCSHCEINKLIFKKCTITVHF